MSWLDNLYGIYESWELYVSEWMDERASIMNWSFWEEEGGCEFWRMDGYPWGPTKFY